MNPWTVIGLLTFACLWIGFSTAVFLSDRPTRANAWVIAVASTVVTIAVSFAAFRAL